MLHLNSKKNQAMIVGTRNKLSNIRDPIPFRIQNHDVQYVNKYNYLGIVLDAEMSLIPLCNNILKRVTDKIYMLRKIGRYLTYKALSLIYKQVILPIIDYAGFLLIACNNDRKGDMQVMQNDALRFCNKSRRADRITLVEMHKKANLSSLEQRRCIQLLTLMYKMSKDDSNRKIEARNMKIMKNLLLRQTLKSVQNMQIKRSIL